MRDYYYLHLSKTCGRFFYKNILTELIFNSNNYDNCIKYLFPKTPVPNWTHHGWHDLISDETYLICSLRDPIEVAISYMLHHGGLEDRKDLFKMMSKFNNLQSKGFIKWQNNMVDPSAHVIFDKDLILSRLKRINFLIDSKDINIKTYNKIKKKIASDIYMTNVNYWEIEDSLEFKTPGVKELLDSLTKEEISMIKKINYMDVELYEAAKSLFFPI
jgi:hypothetical protein